jgi:homoaconitate hydratase family protein/3-isopropylmalate dehydratase small subunit
MGKTIIEKIIAQHSGESGVHPGEIVDVEIDARVARDFGGPNVVKNMREHNLSIKDPDKTFFTFDTNPTGSDQKYAGNQQFCRIFAREHGIKVYDINSGIGTHLLMEEGLVYPGATAVSTDSHANIIGAIGAFGQGMGDRDIAVAWSKGSVWFKVPETVKIYLKGKFPEDIEAKDIALNLLSVFGANTLLGYAVEIYGDEIDNLTLSDRITISSMATEMGAIAILFTPDDKITEYCKARAKKPFEVIQADKDAVYAFEKELDVTTFRQMVSRPGKPHDTVGLGQLKKVKIDSAFVGSCTNGRMEDMREVAAILKGKKVAPGVVLKIVPTTDQVWMQCLEEGLIKIFKEAGALVSNAGCAGCAAGQVGQNGPGEVTVSTGNRNFPGKQGKGEVYLASPSTVAASALAGYITDKEHIPDKPEVFHYSSGTTIVDIDSKHDSSHVENKPVILEGRVWVIDRDDIDTDMIYHNRYLSITDPNEMGKYTFDNLEGYQDFAQKAQQGDMVISGKNFGSGSSRQQAVDCFKSLGIQAVIAQSFGSIYERNAINAAFPILRYSNLVSLDLKTGHKIRVDLVKGKITNLENGKSEKIIPFSEIQLEIYQNGGLF